MLGTVSVLPNVTVKLCLLKYCSIFISALLRHWIVVLRVLKMYTLLVKIVPKRIKKTVTF